MGKMRLPNVGGIIKDQEWVCIKAFSSSVGACDTRKAKSQTNS